MTFIVPYCKKVERLKIEIDSYESIFLKSLSFENIRIGYIIREILGVIV